MGTVAIQIWVQIEVHAHKSKLPEVVLCVFLNRSYSKKLQSLIKLGPPFHFLQVRDIVGEGC